MRPGSGSRRYRRIVTSAISEDIWRTTVAALVAGFKDVQDAMLPALAAVRISPDYGDDAFDEITTCLWEQVVVAALTNSREVPGTPSTASYGFTHDTYRDKVFIGLLHEGAWVVLTRVMPTSGGLVGLQLGADMRPSGQAIELDAGRLADVVAVVPSQDGPQTHRELTVDL